MISKVDSIVGIVFTALFTIIIATVPELLGAWLKTSDGTVVAVPVFNMTVWNTTMSLILISMLAGLIDEVVKLVKGRYCMTVLWSNIVTSMISIIVAAKMLADTNVWNQNFWVQIAEITGETIPEIGELSGPITVVWQGVELNGLNVFMIIIILACMLEMGVTLFRTFRYGMKR